MSIHKAINTENKHLGCVTVLTSGKTAQTLSSSITDYDTTNLEAVLEERLFSNESPLDKYAAANTDTGSNPKYYGFIAVDGSWYIMKENSGAFTYTAGLSDYATSWTGRAGLTYAVFNEVF